MREPTHSTSVPDTVPTLVALHFLGSSAAQWDTMFARLQGRFHCVAFDLPGFGEASQQPGYDVAAMAAHVAAEVRRLAPERWVLVGHSMGAKVACAVARMAEDGAEGLDGLTHLVLMAGSPPGPEPMDDAKRGKMRTWFAGSAAERGAEADDYIRENVANKLTDADQDRLVEAVLQANRVAWVAWLDDGSREDWTDRVGLLQTPVLILAGAKDAALGPDVQKKLMAPHFASALMQTMPHTAHLLPVERPDDVAHAIAVFVGTEVPPEPDLPADYRALIASPRVDARTRTILLERAEPVPGEPGLLTQQEMRTLRALVARIVPQRGEREIDIAGRVLRHLAKGGGDGWRFADLPADMEAFRSGLRNLDAIASTLDVAGFAFLPVAQQDALLEAIAAGKLTSPLPPDDGGLSAHQLGLWFEDMRSLATQIYVAHPATAARIGFSGIANRGDSSGPQGFAQVGLGQRDDWEPSPHLGMDA